MTSPIFDVDVIEMSPYLRWRRSNVSQLHAYLMSTSSVDSFFSLELRRYVQAFIDLFHPNPHLPNKFHHPGTMVQNSLLFKHHSLPHKFGSEWANERTIERHGACEPSEHCGASNWMSCVSEWESGPVLTSGFLVVLDHSALIRKAILSPRSLEEWGVV